MGYRTLFEPAYRATAFTSVMAVFIASLDSLIIGTALPTISERLQGAELYAAALGAYLIASLVGLPVFGAMSDRAGPWRAFLGAGIVFLGGSVIGGLAPSMLVIVLARSIQGFGAGGLFAVGYAAIGIKLPGWLRPYGFGLLSATWGASALIGPAVGAALIALAGWRWIFWFNLPLVLAVLPAARSAFSGSDNASSKDAPNNLRGPVLLGLAGGAMLAAFSAPLAWIGPLACLFLVGTILFVLEERRTRRPVLPALRRPASIGAGAALAAGLTGVALLVVETYLPLFVQAGRGAPVIAAGAILTAGSLGWSAGSILTARVAHHGSRWLLTGGHLSLAVGTVFLIIGVGLHLALAELFVAYILTGMGIGFMSPSLFSMALVDAGSRAAGSATAEIQVLRALGNGLGAGLAGLAFRQAVPDELFRLLGTTDPAGAIRASGLAGYLDSALIDTWVVALLFIVVSAAVSLRLPAVRPDQQARAEVMP